MSIRTPGRATLGLILALTIVAITAGVSFAWNSTCSAAGDACVWRHANFEIPLAAKASSDWTYTDDFFPNSQTALNDQVSSIRNKFDVKDVIWYFDAGYSGTSWCVDHETGFGVLNAHDNKYSSHVVAAGSSC
jgi:hypothetical protein